jgi:prophage tail gpP-like protein
MANEDIIITVNGMGFSGWLEYTSQHAYDKAVGTLDLKISPQPGVPMPINLGDQIQAIVGGRPVLTGHVHDVTGDDDWGHDFRIIHARDKTQDFVDSTVGPQKMPAPPVTLQQVLQKTVSGMGLDFSVIDNVNPEPFQNGEVPSASIDETGHAFGDRMARQRQVLLNTDGLGNLVIDRNMGLMGLGALFRGPPDTPGNNILKAKYHNTDLNRHNLHAVTSQHSTNDQQYWEGQPKNMAEAQSQPLSKQYDTCNDDTVRPQRRKHHRAKHSLQRGKTKGAAAWHSNVSKGRGFEYTATVQGFGGIPGEIWWPGQVIPVFDYKYNISAMLLIVNVRFRRNWSGGTTTAISLTYSDAFSDQCGSTSTAQGRSSSLGDGAPPVQPDDSGSDATSQELVNENENFN